MLGILDRNEISQNKIMKMIVEAKAMNKKKALSSGELYRSTES